MNRNMRCFPLTLILTALLSLSLAACSKETAPPPLQGAAIGGPLALTNQDGRIVRDSDFAGQYRLIYFGYSYCPDVCPVDLQLVGQALRQLEKSDPSLAAKVQPIFISVDPQRDKPAVLAQFVRAFHPRLIGLTGTPEQIAEVAKRYGIYYAKQGEQGAENYLVDHSRILLLFGPKGEPIVIVPHEKGAAAIAAELRRWVK